MVTNCGRKENGWCNCYPTCETNSERLLEIIKDIDNLAVQMKVDGQEGYAHLLKQVGVDLMWIYKDYVEYEE